MRQEEVRGKNRLRAPEVRVRRHERVAGTGGAVGETATSARDVALKLGHAALQIQPQIDGDLLVARSAGVQAASSVADARRQLALDERVHVFVLAGGRRSKNGLVGAGGEDGLEPSSIAFGVGGVQYAGPGQPPAQAKLPRRRPRRGADRSRRSAECDERRVGIAFETS